jgi:hypothetical protein
MISSAATFVIVVLGVSVVSSESLSRKSGNIIIASGPQQIPVPVPVPIPVPVHHYPHHHKDHHHHGHHHIGHGYEHYSPSKHGEIFFDGGHKHYDQGHQQMMMLPM